MKHRAGLGTTRHRLPGKPALVTMSLGVIWLLAGCLLPYPQDMRPLLTPIASEIQPTPTGFVEQFFPAAAEPESGAGGVPETLPAELEGDSPFNAVILIAADNGLNVRSVPGSTGEVLEILPPNTRDLKLTGAQQTVAGVRWVEVRREGESTGWVSGDFVTQQVPGDAFCANSKVKSLLRDAVVALAGGDAAGFAALVHPVRGLTVRLEWWNAEVNFSPASLPTLFESRQASEWGVLPGREEPLRGTFRELALPGLQEVARANYTLACNTLAKDTATGRTQAEALWPYEYTNVNYLALYRPAPEGSRKDWRTWAFGVEIYDDRPTISFLVQYYYED